jgi:hypothetical protein
MGPSTDSGSFSQQWLDALGQTVGELVAGGGQVMLVCRDDNHVTTRYSAWLAPALAGELDALAPPPDRRRFREPPAPLA